MSKSTGSRKFDRIANELGEILEVIKSMFTNDVEVTLILTSKRPGTSNVVVTTAETVQEVLDEVQAGVEEAEVTVANLEFDLKKH